MVAPWKLVPDCLVLKSLAAESRTERKSASLRSARRATTLLPFIPLPGPIWMLGKIVVLSFFVIWLRATYPRMREDQLQRFAWITLVPVTLVWILGVAFVKVA